MNSYPRVAFLPDTFHEINGVAHTSRQLELFARRREIPFLSVHCGPVTEAFTAGAVTVVELKRGPASINLDAHLDADPFLLRYGVDVTEAIKTFGAELIHITGPGDMGTLGCYAAWKLNLPLAISWHTSLHEYAGRRLERLLSGFGEKTSTKAAQAVETLSMDVLGWFYRRARVILAPNRELVDMLARLTQRPVFLMKRGVDTELFSPARRTRSGDSFCVGYVGRLTPEKNVRLLAELGTALTALGRTYFIFLIVGEGSEEGWLREHIPNAVFTGVLRDERLAEAYANMDLFVFPSETDTFGNVVLEALSAGVPVVVTSEGGPKFLVRDGVTGFVAGTHTEFSASVNAIMTDGGLHQRMREAAREYACAQSWDDVFETVFDAYRTCLNGPPEAFAGEQPLLSSRLHERVDP